VFSSDIPDKLPIPFADAAGGGYIRTIPVASQIGIDDGAASLTDGFVPLNATPIGAGGIPPSIMDMNGILYEISGWSRWIAAGGPVFYDAVFATAIGGYPKGGVVQSAVTPGLFFVSTAENNATNPEGGGAANWSVMIPAPALEADVIAGTSTALFITPDALADTRATAAEIIGGVAAGRIMTPPAFFGARALPADVVAGTDDHKYLTPYAIANASSQLMAANGYRMHPPGSDGLQMIDQWGSISVSHGEGVQAVTWPIPFPNACFPPVGIIIGTGSTSNPNDMWLQLNSWSTTGASFQYQSTGGNTGYGLAFRVSGY
jgi:hypothetical protein